MPNVFYVTYTVYYPFMSVYIQRTGKMILLIFFYLRYYSNAPTFVTILKYSCVHFLLPLKLLTKSFFSSNFVKNNKMACDSHKNEDNLKSPP